MRFMGLEPDVKSKSSKAGKPTRAEAFEHARASEPDPLSQLPLSLDNDVTITQ